jgi:hypothetical protein
MLKSAFAFSPVVLGLALAGTLCSCSVVEYFLGSPRVRETHPVVIGGTPEAPSFTPDPVSAYPLDSIQWTHSFSVTVVVDLENVPVTPKQLVLPEGVAGGVMVLDTASAGHYKYTLMVVRAEGDTVVVADPYIDVEPKGRR